MRVGMVCPYDLGRPGGVQAQVLGLAGQLIEMGDEVLIMGPGLPEGEEGVDLGPTVTIPGNASLVPISLDPRVGSRIEGVAGDVDLLHVHEPLMPLISLAALRAGKPVVATFHADPGRWAKGLYRVSGTRLRRLLGPNVVRVTAVSRTASAPLPGDLNVEIVPNGVDLSIYERDLERDATRVCYLGRDEKRKGLDVLLRAWPRVTGECPTAELVVMGADRGLSGITWKGRVDDPSKADVLASSALYVAPNLGGESFGIVLVEAMASGTPVVASDLTAFRDVGGEVVRYFTTGDADDLAETLIDLLRDDSTRDEMSAAGRARASEFDWSRVAAQYRSVYEAALS